MGSRYARNLNDPKIRRIFEITCANFEINLFIHFYPLKKALGQRQRHFLKNFMMEYCLPLQMNTLAKKKFDFHSHVKKCHLGNFSERLIWHFLTYAWKLKTNLDQMYSFEVVNNSPSWKFSESTSAFVQVFFLSG